MGFLRMSDVSTEGQVAYVPGMAPKLTDWKREPSVQDLKADLEASRTSHNAMVANVDRWDSLLKCTGQFKPKHKKNRSAVAPKVAKQQLEWRIPALTEPFNSSPKMFTVSPRSGNDGPSARQNELILNWQFDTKINRVALVDQYVRQNCSKGTAVLMVGWCRITRDVEYDAPVWAHDDPTHPDQVSALNDAYLQQTHDPDAYEDAHPPEMKRAVDYLRETGQPTVVSQIGTQRMTRTEVVANHPTVQVVNLKNFYWDPSCGDDFDQGKFAIRAFETSKADLVRDGRYKNLDRVNWDSLTPWTDPNYEQNSKDPSFQFKDTLRRKVVAYDYYGLWDIHGNEQLEPVVCTWLGDTMIRCELSPFPDGLPPFVVVPNQTVENSIIGEPDAELLEDPQQIIGALMRGIVDLHGRSSAAQTGTAKGFLDPLNKKKWLDGEDFEFNPNMPPENAVKQMSFPEIPGTVMSTIQMWNEQAEALTGVKSFSGGLSGDALGNTATGIRGALDAASKREMAILRRLAGGMAKVGRKIIAMNAILLSEEEVVRVTDSQFVTVRREDLSGEFDLKVDIATAEADNAQAQDLAYLLQTIGPKGDPKMTMDIMAEICRLKRLPEMEAKLRAWQPPPPDPLAQQKMQLEIQVMQAQLAKFQSEVALNDARRQKLMVEADQIDLEITEQETGTNHARDLEKQGAQAQANQQLEVTKAIVKPGKDGERRPNIEGAVGFNELSKAMSDPLADRRQLPAPGTAPVNPVNTPPAMPVQ